MNLAQNSLKISALLISSVLIVSCGSSSDDEAVVVPNAFDGNYDITSVSTVATDINGGTCGDATGLMNILESSVSGSVLSTNGNVFDMSGNVDSEGTFTAGFAQSGQNAATISGQMTSTGGGGNWEDVFECVGTWTAEKR